MQSQNFNLSYNERAKAQTDFYKSSILIGNDPKIAALHHICAKVVAKGGEAAGDTGPKSKLSAALVGMKAEDVADTMDLAKVLPVPNCKWNPDTNYVRVLNMLKSDCVNNIYLQDPTEFTIFPLPRARHLSTHSTQRSDDGRL